MDDPEIHGYREDGSDKWESKRYYTSLGSAVQGLVELGLQSSDAETLAIALAECKSLCDGLVQCLGQAVPHNLKPRD